MCQIPGKFTPRATRAVGILLPSELAFKLTKVFISSSSCWWLSEIISFKK